MLNELVSAIIPTYNRAPQTLERAIESVRNQTYPFIEIIVINDNPPEAEYYLPIKNFCQNFNDIKYLESYGSGACHARNLGTDYAKGAYFAFLDDDDIWLPDKISIQLECFISNVGLVYSNGFWVYTDRYPYMKKTYRNPKSFQEEVTFHDLLYKNSIGTTSQIIVSKKCFLDCGRFDERFIARHDYEFCLRASKKYRLIGSSHFLFEHYYHNGEQIIKNNYKFYIGYSLLYKKYKKEYNKFPIAKSNISYKIARAAYNEKKYFTWIKYLSLAIKNNPKNTREIWGKTLDGNTF